MKGAPRRNEAGTAGALLPAALTVLAAALTPTLPWHTGPALVALGVVAALDRAWIWPALGAAAVWSRAVADGAGGPGGAVILGAAVVLGAARRRRLATGIVVVALALAAKQLVAARLLPAAEGPIPWLVVTLVASAGAVSAARGSRVEAGALGVAGMIVLARLAAVWSVDGVERVRAAAAVGAVPLVYDALAAEADPALAAALLRVAPARDAAALRLGWARALDLGWRPTRAEGVVVPVARALEARGRGGEALRLLARHPREGEVDALRALLERVQGAPVRWRGAPLGPELPGRFDPALRFQTGGWAAVELTARAPLAELVIEGEGTPYQGPPLLEVRLDGGPAVPWALDGPATLRVPGPIEPGPHRLDLFFVNDRADAGGDRNVVITSIGGA